MVDITGIYMIRGPNFPGFTYMDNMPIVDREFDSIKDARAYAWRLITANSYSKIHITSWDVCNRVHGIVGTLRMRGGIAIYEENGYYSNKRKSRTYGVLADGSLYSLE